MARTTLATGMYGPHVGTQFHRRIKSASLPEGWRMFPFYLRDAGYYTTNNVKKDCNADEGSAQGRRLTRRDDGFVRDRQRDGDQDAAVHSELPA